MIVMLVLIGCYMYTQIMKIAKAFVRVLLRRGGGGGGRGGGEVSDSYLQTNVVLGPWQLAKLAARAVMTELQLVAPILQVPHTDHRIATCRNDLHKEEDIIIIEIQAKTAKACNVQTS
jgi:hypothetical protein